MKINQQHAQIRHLAIALNGRNSLRLEFCQRGVHGQNRLNQCFHRAGFAVLQMPCKGTPQLPPHTQGTICMKGGRQSGLAIFKQKWPPIPTGSLGHKPRPAAQCGQ
jgi:hypothetical protein